MDITKICRKCGKETAFTDLVKHKQCSFGVDALCKICNRKTANDWYYNNKERALKTQKEYNERNAEKVRQYKRRWQIDNREHLKAYHAEWRHRPEQAWYRQKVLETGRIWRENNRQHHRELIRRWGQLNIERRRVNVRNRRAIRRKSPGNFTTRDLSHQYAEQGGLCFWCRTPLGDNFHVDHVIPISKGGTNSPENIVCACSRCNLSKGDRLPFTEWQPPNPLRPML